MILLAPDKFKGSATAAQVAEAAERGIREVLREAQVLRVPVADGGDGTLCALAEALPAAQWRSCRVASPAPEMPAHEVRYLILPDGTAVMELAAASGMALLGGALCPMRASTVGTGQMIAHALQQGGCRHVVLGIGGSASTDCGTGLLSALGIRFLDASGRELTPCGESLGQIAAIDDRAVPPAVRQARFTLMCDVSNPLFGPNGAACVFAPQKGATAAQVAALEAGVRHFAALLPAGVAERPGAGAAGGVGAGMMALLGAELKPGAHTVLQLLGFDALAARASVIVTGEGQLDASSACGKAPAAVLNAGRRHGVPVVALCGRATPAAATMGFSQVVEVSPRDMPLSEAMRTAVTLANVQRAAARLAISFVE